MAWDYSEPKPVPKVADWKLAPEPQWLTAPAAPGVTIDSGVAMPVRAPPAAPREPVEAPITTAPLVPRAAGFRPNLDMVVAVMRNYLRAQATDKRQAQLEANKHALELQLKEWGFGDIIDFEA